MAKSLAYNQSNSFISFVFFASAKYTECIQIVDIISYLLQKEELISAGKSNSQFSKDMYGVIRGLNMKNIINHIGDMKFLK